MKRRGVFISIALFACASAGVWGFVVEPDLLLTRTIEVESRRWPPDRAPLRVAVVGDLHVGAPHIDLAKVDEIVDRVNALRPDLVVLLGDYVIHRVTFGSFVAPEPTAERLGRLSAPLGVISVLGNHDWWYDGKRVWRALETAGIAVLENRALRLRTEDGPLWIAGLADDTTRSPDARGTLAAVPDDEPAIVLAHDPVSFLDVPWRVVMTLAAHTHGGQVYVPFFGAPFIPGRAPRRFAYGLISEDDKDMYVTSGIGTSIVSVRFNMPPEIALVTIRPAAGAD